MCLVKKIFVTFLFIVPLSFFINISTSYGASSPYDVESSVRNNWSDTYGSKAYKMATGRQISYDVYSRKYTSGGYKIVNKNFGKGYQPYLNFQGWAVILGHKRHTRYNHETYIVAQHTTTKETKVYGTLPYGNLSATEEVEYNNQGSGVWNECASWQTNKSNYPPDNNGCNMRYDNVGFNAYLPLDELFPNAYEASKWQLFIVKRVDSHIVYTPLILPFDFNSLNHNGGEIKLSSGVNANNLIMNGYPVIRRPSPRSTSGGGAEYGYFTQWKTYKRVDVDERGTLVWYGVRSPHDGGRTRWTSSAYWNFGGDQAILSFTPDDKPPVHIADDLWSHMYRNGNDYWTQPNDIVYIRLKQRDVDSGNKYQYLRLDGSGVDARSRHSFNSADGNHYDFMTSSHVNISTPNRTENTDYGAVNWKVIPKTHGHNYNVLYYYRDNANNSIGYNDTGLDLRVDGVAPSHLSDGLSGAKYVNGNDYWVNSGDQVTISLRQRDTDSGNKYQYLRLEGSGVDVRARHEFAEASNYIGSVSTGFTSPDISIDSANRTENTTYGKVNWKVTPKKHGQSYNVLYHYTDNVDNANGYDTGSGDTGFDIRVDDIAPVINFRNKADTSDFHSRDWSDESIDVRLKFSDEHSGYKRSRYVWTQSATAPNESQWSNWTTSSNYVVSKNKFGKWYLHVQSEDNVGNRRNTYQSVYKFNTPPELTLSYNPGDVYEGDEIAVCVEPTDADGNKMTVTIQSKENGTYKTVKTASNVSSGQNVCYNLTAEYPKNYTFKGTVDDGTESSSVEINFETIGLGITGRVLHTPEWQKIHERLGHEPNQFYSGEKFILEADIVNHPRETETVESLFKGKQENGNIYSKNINLNEISPVYYKGELNEPLFLENGTSLVNGSKSFQFKVNYSHGVVKKDTVTIEVIGGAYEALYLHRLH